MARSGAVHGPSLKTKPMLKRSLLIALAALAVTGGGANAQSIQPSWAQPERGRSERDRERERILPVREIIEIARNRFGGGENVGGVRLESGDRPVYVLRWRLPNGDLRDLRIDAVTGQVFG